MGELLPLGGRGLGWRGVERWAGFLGVAAGLAVGVGRRLWERLGIVAGRARRSAQAGSIAPPALAAALRVRRVERHVARRGDLRLDPRGNGLPDRRRLLAAQLDSGNPPLLRDPLDAELARQRPIAAAPTPAIAELEPFAATDELARIYSPNAKVKVPERLWNLIDEEVLPGL